MGTFKDTKEREWRLSLTFGKVGRIRELTGVPILRQSAKGGWEWLKLPYDTEKFLEAIWFLIATQAEKQSVTRADFEDAFDSDTYQLASAAFYDAVLSFSPLPAVLQSTMGTGEEIIRRLLNSTPNDGDGNSPAESESTLPA